MGLRATALLCVWVAAFSVAAGCQPQPAALEHADVSKVGRELVPAEVSKKIVPLSDVEFDLDRSLVPLLGQPDQFREHRPLLDGQVVSRFFGRTLKLSPEQDGDQLVGMRLYLDLDVIIVRATATARAIFETLGLEPEQFEGNTEFERARAAITLVAEVLVERARAGQSQTPEYRAGYDAYTRAASELDLFYAFTPNIEGSLPALLGFQHGDLIVSINGQAAHSYGQAGDILAALGDDDRIDVDLLRRETPLRLTYHLR